VESLAADFDPTQYEDRYAAALEELIQQKVSSGHTQAVPVPAGEKEEGAGEVVDLLAALQRSVEKARTARGEEPEEASTAKKAKKPKKSGDDDTPARRTRRKAS
jgi:DNA end-binding protein Ku